MSEEKSIPQEKSVAREYAEAIVIALLLALFIRTFIVQAFKIPSGSMKNTLLVGDHILVNKFLYGIRNPVNGHVLIPVTKPKHNDVIVFKYPLNPDQDYIKRVIGVEGDTVEIIDKQVYVNNQPVDNSNSIFLDPNILPASQGKNRDNLAPVTVPENSYFVMGDNRDQSYDSRFWNFVEMDAIKGKAFILYWSWDKDNFAWKWNRFFPVRWNRVGKLVH